MNINEDLILGILRLALEKDVDGSRWTWIDFRDIPSVHSTETIRRHLECCEERGLIERKPTISLSEGVSLTPDGIEYVRNHGE